MLTLKGPLFGLNIVLKLLYVVLFRYICVILDANRPNLEKH